MDDFPKPILRYISDLTVRSLSPAYVCVDLGGAIVEWGGNPASFGVSTLSKGTDAVDAMPFLLGLLPPHTDPFVLYGVKMNGQLSSDVHIFRDGDRFWILLLDANMREIQQFVVQQQLNIAALREWRNEKLFSQFLSREVSDKLSDGIPVIESGGRRLSIIAVELRGCDLLYADGPAQDFVNSLNTYMVSIIDPILEEGGFVDKLAGFSINGVFGFPRAREDGPVKALLTANKIAANVSMLNGIRKKYARPSVSLGVGIASGEGIMSIIGNYERKSFTALGTTVERANDLMTLGEDGEILIDENSKNGLGAYASSFKKTQKAYRRLTAAESIYVLKPAQKQ